MKNKIPPFTVIRIIVALVLLWELAQHSYDNHKILLWAVFITCGYSAFLAYKRGKNYWAVVLGITATLCNQIVPIHFNNNMWIALKLLAATIIFASIFKVRVICPRFTTVNEFYQAVDLLIEKLRAENCNDEANQLHSLLHQTAWTTGSELLGELMLALKKMNGRYSSALYYEIAECLEFTLMHN